MEEVCDDSCARSGGVLSETSDEDGFFAELSRVESDGDEEEDDGPSFSGARRAFKEEPIDLAGLDEREAFLEERSVFVALDFVNHYQLRVKEPERCILSSASPVMRLSSWIAQMRSLMDGGGVWFFGVFWEPEGFSGVSPRAILARIKRFSARERALRAAFWS